MLLKTFIIPGVGIKPGSSSPEKGTLKFTTSGQTYQPEEINTKGAPIYYKTYILDAFWSTDEAGDEKITKTHVGERVYLYIKTKNIDDDEHVTINLFDDDFLFFFDDKVDPPTYSVHSKESETKTSEEELASMESEDETSEVIVRPVVLNAVQLSTTKKIVVKDNKAIVRVRLTDTSLNKYIREDHGKDIELYAKVDYQTQRNVTVPRKSKNYLMVKPQDINGKIVFQSASELHSLPMMFDANSGDPYYIDARKKTKEGALYSNKIKGVLIPQKMDMFTKKSYEFAVRRLKAGDLAFNDGSVGKTSRFYKQTVRNIDDTFSERIVMGINKGKFGRGVTSKGINQLEAFSGRGIAGGAKFIGSVLPLFSTAIDLSSMVVAVDNGEKPPIPFMPPFVTWEVEKMCNEIDEYIYDTFLYNLNLTLFGQSETDRKGIDAVEHFLQRWAYLQRDVPKWKYNWQVVRLSQKTLEKLLKGEIERKEFISDLTYEDEGKELNCGILVLTNFEEDDVERAVVKHYIYAVFLPEIIE